MKKSLLFLSCLFLILLFVTPVRCEDKTTAAEDRTPDLSGQIMGQIESGAEKAELSAPAEPQIIVASIAKGILSVVATVFLMWLVFGGYTFVTAHGDEEKAKKGAGIIRTAIIGFTVIMMSYGIVSFISKKVKQSVVKSVPYEN